MVDDGHAPTIPETEAPTHPSSKASAPRAPDPRYEMRALLGRGGMGEIWAAYDVRVDREVAVKLMRGGGASDPDAVARFLREARVQGRLEHPAIVPVHDLGIGDEPYFVMKRLTGTTLADVLAAKTRGDGDASERWPTRILLARLVDVCLAIELAHQGGVIHRDLKPANIMLGDFGEAYVLDWGLARIQDGGDAHIRGSDLPSDPGQTVAGAMLGTPGYMAPEQVRGEAVDMRADIYALGCILFEILAGQPAVPRDSAIEATLAGQGHRPSRVGEVAPELDDVCVRATAATASDRHASARALADDIQRFLDGDRDLARRRELAAQHVASAERALASDDRAAAMREAGRAIAIDPDGTAAQDLMKRLLFELPREVPAEARAQIDAERDDTIRAVLRKGAYAYAGNLALVPAAKLLGVSGVWPFVVVSALLVVLIAGCAIGSRPTRRVGTPLIVTLITAHTAVLAAVGTFFGPILFAPIFAFGSLPVFLMFPALRIPKLALFCHLGAVFVPLALEQLGVLPASFWSADGALVLKPWAISFEPAVLVGFLLGIVCLQMIVATVLFTSQRDAQERAQERLHVYSWHLAQLVR